MKIFVSDNQLPEKHQQASISLDYNRSMKTNGELHIDRADVVNANDNLAFTSERF
jgi:hypothetical protein